MSHYIAPVKKPNVYRIYLNEEYSTLLAELCEVTEMAQTEALGRICQAGLKAVKENSMRMVLPLRMKVTEGDLAPKAPYACNDSPTPKRGIKPQTTP